LSVVSGNVGLLLHERELARSRLHLVGTVVDEPQSTHSGDGERDTVGPLDDLLVVWRATLAGVEDQEQENEDDLVDDLTPTLHQESGDDLATTVKTVIAGRDLTRTDSVLHGGSGSHGVFTTDTDRVEPERPSVADDPAVLGGTPGSSKHKKTDEHDDSVLNETPATTDGVTDETDHDLTADDTDDFEVGEGLCPCLVASLVRGPAPGETSSEKRCDVADGEEHVSKGLSAAGLGAMEF